MASVDPLFAQWLQADGLWQVSEDAALRARWGDVALTTERMTTIALKADAVAEAQRQLAFLGPAVTEGQIIISMQAILLFVAWLWKGGSDRLVYALAGSFVAALWVDQTLSGIERHVTMTMLDVLVVAVATRVWIGDNDLRGWTVGLLGLSKICARLFFTAGQPVVESHMAQWVFAAAINAAFVAQVIIAGGLVDELGRRIAAHLRHAGPRRARLLRNVEGR